MSLTAEHAAEQLAHASEAVAAAKKACIAKRSVVSPKPRGKNMAAKKRASPAKKEEVKVLVKHVVINPDAEEQEISPVRRVTDDIESIREQLSSMNSELHQRIQSGELPDVSLPDDVEEDEGLLKKVSDRHQKRSISRRDVKKSGFFPSSPLAATEENPFDITAEDLCAGATHEVVQQHAEWSLYLRDEVHALCKIEEGEEKWSFPEAEEQLVRLWREQQMWGIALTLRQSQ